MEINEDIANQVGIKFLKIAMPWPLEETVIEKFSENLEKIIVANDTISQKSNYFLAQSYIKVDKKKYALNAFRQCVKSDVDKKIYEESYYNLTKLAFEVNSKNDDVLKILSDFLQKFPNSIYYKEIEDLTLKFYFNSKNYKKIYENLLAKNNLSDYERKQFYKSALQLAIQSYNTKDFKKAIVFLEELFSFNCLFASD